MTAASAGAGAAYPRPRAGHAATFASRGPRGGGQRCQLVCVDPARVQEIWPHVRALIFAAMQRGDLSSFRPVEDRVLRGDALLWIAWSGDPRSGSGARHIEAAAVTELQETEWRKVCLIVACAGKAMIRWLALAEEIEGYARAQGCSCVRIVGRKGWARVLSSYKTKRIILEKDL
jgi:hypothetical protein